jgi:single-stranded-DNA-specific exonuclease
MIGVLDQAGDLRADTRAAFEGALADFAPDRPALVVSHFDADGLSAAAVLARALRERGRAVEVRITGKGETPWELDFRAELAARAPGGLIVADLGTRAEPVLPGCPTVVIDHHVPTGAPEGATTISGNGLSPEPTSALLAYWAVGAPEHLAWLPALGPDRRHGRRGLARAGERPGALRQDGAEGRHFADQCAAEDGVGGRLARAGAADARGRA